MVDGLAVAEKLGQRQPGGAALLSDGFLFGAARKAAKLGNDLPQRAVAPEILSARQMGGEIAFEPGLIVPMGRSRVARLPLRQSGCDGALSTRVSSSHRTEIARCGLNHA